MTGTVILIAIVAFVVGAICMYGFISAGMRNLSGR